MSNSTSNSDGSEDERALGKLVVAVARAIDHRDAPALAATFSADAVFEGHGFRREGNQVIAADLVELVSTNFLRTFHQLQNHHIELAGDEATGELYGTAGHVFRSADGSLLCMTGVVRYDDRYRRGADGWQVAHRTIASQWTTTTPVHAFDLNDLSPH